MKSLVTSETVAPFRNTNRTIQDQWYLHSVNTKGCVIKIWTKSNSPITDTMQIWDLHYTYPISGYKDDCAILGLIGTANTCYALISGDKDEPGYFTAVDITNGNCIDDIEPI